MLLAMLFSVTTLISDLNQLSMCMLCCLNDLGRKQNRILLVTTFIA